MIEKVLIPQNNFHYASCFDGYLTPECATCICWADGSNPDEGLGCARNFAVCDALERVCKLHECRRGWFRYAIKNGIKGVIRAVDTEDIQFNILVDFEDGTSAWRNVDGLNLLRGNEI